MTANNGAGLFTKQFVLGIIITLGAVNVSFTIQAADIAYGTLTGVKLYDFSNSKLIKVHFAADATHKDEVSCNGVGTITYGQHEDAVINQMLSIAMAGYLSGVKLRAYAEHSGSCEIDLITIQKTYF
ncbi:hypothetical protein HWQ46_15100 [Shewanella sp. D64]|uniref:hypothetical protein n=1 Tax=unclassified Shewanella TaxID=196818 RepID=UPI0022BA267B|nr:MULTISPECIES: hypothetical protein [unclassified Shewanella]MEC4726878.1 hypothetical protein [Shewanella sp. D64]MEC4738625.1 hypothetical protein [Shewanella sp. E94]WBJ93840.1 hypothetical protein HWQ47_18165 [Shewanella sp. MTB7]